MSLMLVEKRSYDYIYVNPIDNGVHILLPLSGGDYVGIDNTCKARLEFYYFRQKICAVINNYIEDLTQDIQALNVSGLDVINSQKKQERLRQLIQYRDLINIVQPNKDISDAAVKDLFKPFIAATQADETNYVFIQLCPLTLDRNLVADKPLISFNRNFGKLALANHLKIFKERIEYVLRELGNKFKQRILDEVGEEYVRKYADKTIENDEDLNNLKDIFAIILEKHHLPVSRKDIEKSMFGGNVLNVKLMEDQYGLLSSTAPLKDWIACTLDTFTDFSTLTAYSCGYSLFHNKNLSYNQISIMIQLFFAVTNTYHYTKTGRKENLAKEVEKAAPDGEDMPPLIYEFFQELSREIVTNFDIPAAIFKFINAQKGKALCFFDEDLTEKEQELIINAFNKLWQIISQSEHHDEYVIQANDKNGPFHNLHSRISLSFDHYLSYLDPSIYEDHFSKDKGSLPCLTGVPRLLPVDNLTAIKIEFETKVLSIYTSSALATLLKTKLNENDCVFSYLSSHTIELLKARPDWQEVIASVISSGLDAEKLTEFMNIFGINGCYYMSVKELQILISSISFDASKAISLHDGKIKTHPLNYFYGLEKIRKGLELFDIHPLDIEFNGKDFVITFAESESAKSIEILSNFKRRNNTQLHITRAMSATFYGSAESSATQKENAKISIKLKELTNTTADATKSKLAYALLCVLRIPPENILEWDQEPSKGQIRIGYFGDNGFKVEGDQQLIDKLYACLSCNLITSISNAELATLTSNSPMTVDQQSVEAMLDENSVSYIGVSRQEDGWSIALENTADFTKLTTLTRRSQLFDKANKIAAKFQLALESSTPTDSLSLPTHFIFKFNDATERKKFFGLVNKYYPSAKISELSDSKLQIDADSILALDLKTLVTAAEDFSSIKSECNNIAFTLAKAFGLQIVKDNATKKGGVPFFRKSESRSMMTTFVLDAKIFHHRLFINYFKQSATLIEQSGKCLLTMQNSDLIMIDAMPCIQAIHLTNRISEVKQPVDKIVKDPALIDCQYFISEAVYLRVAEYKLALENKTKFAGGFLSEKIVKLGMPLADLSIYEFIQLLLQTKTQNIAAKEEVALFWNSDEVNLLSAINLSVRSTIFTNGAELPHVHSEPFIGTIIYSPATPWQQHDAAVTKDCIFIKHDAIDADAIAQFYEETIISLLRMINERSATSDKKVFVTLPAIDYRGVPPALADELDHCVVEILQRLIEKQADQLKQIAGICYHTPKGGVNYKKELDHLCFMAKSIDIKTGLNPPSSYDAKFASCELVSITGCDALSWDLNAKEQRFQGPLALSASDTFTKISGIPGKFEPVAGGYQSSGDFSFEEIITQENIVLGLGNSVYIERADGVVEKLDKTHQLSKKYEFTREELSNLIPILSSFSLSAESIKNLLNNLDIDVKKVEILPSGRFLITMPPAQYDSLLTNNLSGKQLVLSTDNINTLNAIYFISDEKLANDQSLTACEKLSSLLNSLGISHGEIKKCDASGYQVACSQKSFDNINLILAQFNATHLPRIKNKVIDMFKTALPEKLMVFSKFGDRIAAINTAINRMRTLADLELLLQNQLALVSGDATGPKIPSSVCDTNWTEKLTGLHLYKERYEKILIEINKELHNFISECRTDCSVTVKC